MHNYNRENGRDWGLNWVCLSAPLLQLDRNNGVHNYLVIVKHVDIEYVQININKLVKQFAVLMFVLCSR